MPSGSSRCWAQNTTVYRHLRDGWLSYALGCPLSSVTVCSCYHLSSMIFINTAIVRRIKAPLATILCQVFPSTSKFRLGSCRWCTSLLPSSFPDCPSCGGGAASSGIGQEGILSLPALGHYPCLEICLIYQYIIRGRSFSIGRRLAVSRLIWDTSCYMTLRIPYNQGT